jgi:hypothetical protein
VSEIVTAVEPSDGGRDGVFHLVSIEYIDADGVPEDQLLWETEQQLGATTLEPSALPDFAGDAPMAPAEFDALVRATRWTALTPYVDPDGSDGPLGLPLLDLTHSARADAREIRPVQGVQQCVERPPDQSEHATVVLNRAGLPLVGARDDATGRMNRLV